MARVACVGAEPLGLIVELAKDVVLVTLFRGDE